MRLCGGGAVVCFASRLDKKKYSKYILKYSPIYTGIYILHAGEHKSRQPLSPGHFGSPATRVLCGQHKLGGFPFGRSPFVVRCTRSMGPISARTATCADIYALEIGGHHEPDLRGLAGPGLARYSLTDGIIERRLRSPLSLFSQPGMLCSTKREGLFGNGVGGEGRGGKNSAIKKTRYRYRIIIYTSFNSTSLTLAK